MRIIRTQSAADPENRGSAAAIGNFDGVHLGHQAVIDVARGAAAADKAALAVMTFEPHPRNFFTPDAPPFRLMNAAARAHRLEKLGVDILFEFPFSAELASLSPEDFASRILRDGLGLKHAIVGADFRFGRDRSGTAEELRAFGKDFGFNVSVVPMLDLAEGPVSSTAIRDALTEGDPRTAARMLGHWHRIEGTIEQGDQRGRELGYPTANMSIAGLHPPKFGVYAVRAEVLTGPHIGRYEGAASIGVRPTFGVNAPNCETFLFDFKGDLYGAEMSVALIEYLRPEVKFTTVEALIRQMDADCETAARILAHV